MAHNGDVARKQTEGSVVKNSARTIIIAAIVLCLGTVAFAVAQTAEQPALHGIPTVVTDKPVASTVPPTGASTTIASTTDSVTPVVTKKLPVGGHGAGYVAPPAITSAANTSGRTSSSSKSNSSSGGGNSSPGREVVTPHVRDDSDGDSSGKNGERAASISSPQSTSVPEVVSQSKPASPSISHSARRGHSGYTGYASSGHTGHARSGHPGRDRSGRTHTTSRHFRGTPHRGK